MSSTTERNGRLGNQLIRNLALSLIAEKNNLKVNYHNRALIESLGIPLFSGDLEYAETQELNDLNYFSTYNESVTHNLDPNKAYFQTKEITNFLLKHIRALRPIITEKNPFRERYENNNDLFVHVRLGDAHQHNPGVNYYLGTIRAIQFDNLYISTDERGHSIIQTLLQQFPGAQLFERDEITTFHFASTCKHIVLSHGSFSAIIGYLSFFSNVYYPEYEKDKMWYGDMFSIEGWTKMAL